MFDVCCNWDKVYKYEKSLTIRNTYIFGHTSECTPSKVVN